MPSSHTVYTLGVSLEDIDLLEMIGDRPPGKCMRRMPANVHLQALKTYFDSFKSVIFISISPKKSCSNENYYSPTPTVLLFEWQHSAVSLLLKLRKRGCISVNENNKNCKSRINVRAMNRITGCRQVYFTCFIISLFIEANRQSNSQKIIKRERLDI